MKVGTFIAGLLLILAGLIIFLANIGYGSPVFAAQLSRFWPVLLILIGISFFWGGVIPRLLGILLIIALSGGIVFLALQNPFSSFHFSRGQRETELVVERSRYAGVTSAEIAMKFGGGKIMLDSGTGQFAEGLFRGASGAVTSVKRHHNKVKIDIRPAVTSWFSHLNNMNNWEVHLSPELPWEISVEAGAAEGDLDFTGLDFQQLELKLDAGDFRFKFGNNGEYGKVKMQAGASNVRIQVDANSGVRIRLQGALSSNNLDELGWSRVDDYYVSPAFDEALSRIDLDLKMGVGNLELEIPSTQGIHL